MVLICFEAITSLKVNLGKSQVVPIGEVDTIASLLDILCFRLGSLLMNYLGMPLGSHFDLNEEAYFRKDGKEIIWLEEIRPVQG